MSFGGYLFLALLGTTAVPLEQRLTQIKGQDDQKARNELIEDYVPFILRVLSNLQNKYIELENSEEYSIGLLAFNEAIDKYQPERGHFLPYAELVIKNRVKDLWRTKENEAKEGSLEASLEKPAGIYSLPKVEFDEEAIFLRQEIKRYEEELAKFHIHLEDLLVEAPKHQETREKAGTLAQKVSQDPPLVEEIYAKRKLPITKIALKYQTTVKILKRSKSYILSLIVIYTGEFQLLKEWIRDAR